MHDIFISYSRADKLWVEKLAAALQAEGYKVWWDPEILAGEDYEQIISAALEASRCVVTVWSQHSIQSFWVKEESNRALQANKLVPILLEMINPPMPFGRIHTEDLTRWKGKPSDPNYQKLLRAISRHASLDGIELPQAQPPASAKKWWWLLAPLALAVSIAGWNAFDSQREQLEIHKKQSELVSGSTLGKPLSGQEAAAQQAEEAKRQKQAEKEAEEKRQQQLAAAQAAQQAAEARAKAEAEAQKTAAAEQARKQAEEQANAEAAEQARKLAEEQAKAEAAAKQAAEDAREQQLNNLKTQIASQIKASKLTSPSGDNALETLQALEQAGIASSQLAADRGEIVEKYLAFSRTSSKKADWDKASEYLDRAKQVDANDERIAQAEQQLATQQKKAEQEAEAERLAAIQARQKKAEVSAAQGRKIGQYIDHGDGTVSDTKTGLMWKKCYEGQSGANCENGKAEIFTWDNAMKSFGRVSFGKYRDWRMPTREELKTQVYCSSGVPNNVAWDNTCSGKNRDKKYTLPTIRTDVFPNTQSEVYWSSSPSAGYSDYAWGVNLAGGNGYEVSKTRGSYVRLVRSGQ